MSLDSSVYRKYYAIDVKCSRSGKEEQISIGGRKNWPVSIKVEFTQKSCFVCRQERLPGERDSFPKGVTKINVNAALAENNYQNVS